MSRWLTSDQKRTRMKISEECLERLKKLKLNLWVDLLLWMRLGFTITHQNPNSSKNSGKKPVVQRQRRQVRFHQQERPWQWWFGMLKAFVYYLETGKTMTGEFYSNLLTRLDKKFMSNDPVCKREKSFLIRTMHLPKKCFSNGKVKGFEL